MKKGDFLFLSIFLLIVAILVIPLTRAGFEQWTEDYPYLMGFLKTSVLATMGELLASRISTGRYFNRIGIAWRWFAWGCLGFAFVLMFKVFAAGVAGAIDTGLLPDLGSGGFGTSLYRAFMTSLIMNLIFAPTFMILHRVTDTYIDLGKGHFSQMIKTPFGQVIQTIDWKRFFGFVVLVTIPFFWVPAHTITFLLPENYRVLMAGFLSIALGLILTLSSIQKGGQKHEKLS